MLKRNRRGRSYSSASKRNQTTREGQGRSMMPVEPLLQRLRMAGLTLPPFLDDRGNERQPRYREVRDFLREHRLLDVETISPLTWLLRDGKLIDKHEEREFGPARAAAGARYAHLHDLHYGLPPQAQAFGFVAPLNEDEIAAIVKRERIPDRVVYSRLQVEWIANEMLRRMQRALKRHGRHVAAVTDAVVIHGQAPRPAALKALRTGLASLCVVDRIEHSDVPLLVEAA